MSAPWMARKVKRIGGDVDYIAKLSPDELAWLRAFEAAEAAQVDDYAVRTDAMGGADSLTAEDGTDLDVYSPEPEYLDPREAEVTRKSFKKHSTSVAADLLAERRAQHRTKTKGR